MIRLGNGNAKTLLGLSALEAAMLSVQRLNQARNGVCISIDVGRLGSGTARVAAGLVSEQGPQYALIMDPVLSRATPTIVS